MKHRRTELLTLLAIVSGIVNFTLAGTASAAAPAEADVQGIYEGTGGDAMAACKIEARIVAQGNGNYNVFIRRIPCSGEIVRAELQGKTVDDAVTITGKAGEVQWQGQYAAGTIKGECCPGGPFELKRVERKSPTLDKKPPEGAVVLLDGVNFAEMTHANGTALEPDKLDIGADHSIQVPKGGMNSQRTFEGNFDLHVEFLIPLMPGAHGQGRGNSGVYLPNRDEIQVLDSFGEGTYTGGGCGGLYAYKDPDPMEPIESLAGKPEGKFSLASLPPLCWQTFDVEYRVGTPDGKAHVTVCHNGVKIHDNAELRNPPNNPSKFHFQDHGNPVRYRNIWVLPVATPPKP